jgi:hypothetical protein
MAAAALAARALALRALPARTLASCDPALPPSVPARTLASCDLHIIALLQRKRLAVVQKQGAPVWAANAHGVVACARLRLQGGRAERARKVSGEGKDRCPRWPRVHPRVPRLASPRAMAPLPPPTPRKVRFQTHPGQGGHVEPRAEVQPGADRAATSCRDRTRAPSSARGLNACDMLLCYCCSADWALPATLSKS